MLFSNGLPAMSSSLQWQLPSHSQSHQPSLLLAAFGLHIIGSHFRLPIMAEAQVLPINGTCPVCFNCNAKGCNNFGTCMGGACFCPDGFGSQDCSQPTCGSLLIPPDLRPIRPAASSCVCDPGFSGINCNICTSDNVCASMRGKPLGTHYICNNSTKVWRTDHHSSCSIKNTLLAAVYPGATEVSFKRDTLKGAMLATLWYLEIPQFSCNITGCGQSLLEQNVNWACSSVSCRCNTGSKYCGGGGVIDLTDSINKANGGLGILCNQTTATCSLGFDFLKGVFPQGLGMQNCRFGECVDETASPPLFDGTPKVVKIDAYGYAGIGLATVIFIGIMTALVLGLIQQSRFRQLPPVIEQDGMSVQFKDISYSVGSQTIISDISGFVEPGSMLAIIGPSGAGKSTFLDILAGKAKTGTVKGTITVGNDLSRSTLRRLSGFVDQEDVFISTMTVREALEFSAALRLPESLSARDRKHRIEEVMDELGLTHIQNTRIGDSLSRGISGGEKRRLSIGVELVTNPAVIYLDEPTSGLDSYNAVQVMETLATLSHKWKRTVIFSIHQPRSDVFALFDQILLLSKGTTVFFGRTDSAADYLAGYGIPCPPGYNLADHLIDVATKYPAGLPINKQVVTPDSITPKSTNSDVQWRFKSNTKNTFVKSGDAKIGSYKLEPSHEVIYDTHAEDGNASLNRREFTASFLTQLSVLLGRSWVNFWRQPGLFIAHTSIAAVLGVFLGALYWKSDSSLAGIQNRLGSIFFIQSLIGFSSMTAISVFSREKLLFIRERSNGYYGAGPLFISKMLFDLIPLRVLPGLILSTIPFFMIGYTSGPGYFIRYVGIMLIFSANCGLFCLALGCAFIEYGTAILVASMLLLFQMLFAGLLVNQLQIPTALSWLQYLSFFKYAFEAVVVNDASGLRFVDTISGVEIGISASVVLAKFGIDMDGFWRDYCVSVGIFILFMSVAAYLVARRMREKRDSSVHLARIPNSHGNSSDNDHHQQQPGPSASKPY
ncbi:hypothetical protein BASA50_002640 [Batrachochytrium salamandrivorans]|uniref:ABC transporter domain-containing protein n=1 Tax=Batrachochytrium salamandrivorans TaxID=1357716 RepID=A0ABQ8FKX1_9FUNG|nr:hypothetical protein BASA50_002640 [Batrachochytrium salamandrivorans]